MADSNDSASPLKINIKGPSDLRLSIDITSDQTVRQLKEAIEKQKPDLPADAQRLIYAGKVLKDEEILSVYKIKDGNTVHMVKSAARSAPTTGNPSVPGTAPSGTGSSNNAASSQSQGVPSNFSAGQNFTNNPLSALNRADYAGPHMARLLNESGGAFGGMGLNPRDPNMMMGLMQNPEVQRQMQDMMSRPEFIDQMLAMNPQLQGMAPQMREMMRSEQFREMITNPETMQRMAQMSQLMESAGMGGMGGLGGLGGFGAGGGGNGGNRQWPPPGAFGESGGNNEDNANNSNNNGNDNTSGRNNGQGNTGNFSGNFNGLRNTGGDGAAPPNPFADPSFLQQMFGGGGGGGGGAGGFGGLGGLVGLGGLGGFEAGAGGAASRDTRPPEERFSSQLEQMQSMGFYDGQANVRALLMAGGSVEGAIGILLDNPNPPPQGN
ncbi:related to DSK2-ubiquitin-like protein [Ustilago bromivora]|uniref:Related to DSK2 - ubiquitin-like protein n=1 Tax=Ustilago bromivora TaxID=307758 RepID=A0A1K0FYR7_9BASI|nr:related to DSK2-ubiquitin-like protein [Ustilago bromivora]SYW74812.1 related to DSK2 - ubiquitin-like protein [Ustilago bromivora]